MRKIDPFHYGRIEKDEVNQQAFENYFQLIDEAERFYNDQIRRVVKKYVYRQGQNRRHLSVRSLRFGKNNDRAYPGKAFYQQRQKGNGHLLG